MPIHPPIRFLLLLAVPAWALMLPCRPAAAQWQADGAPVCTAIGDQTAPVLVRNGGGAFVIWQDARSTPTRIYAQRLAGTGEPLWAANGVQVATATFNQKAPVAVGDGVGGVIITWVQESLAGDDVWAQRLDGSGARLWPAGGVAVCTAAGPQNGLALVSDNRAPLIQTPGVMIAWSDARGGAGTDVYIQALDSSGSPRWTANGVPVCTATGDQNGVVMVTDGIGAPASNPRGAILAWLDGRAGGGALEVYTQRVSAGGVVQWTANGVDAVTAPSVQLQPAIAFVGAGVAVIAWSDSRGALHTTDIYAQRVDNGALSWAADGVPVCTQVNGQAYPAVVADGAGGAIVAWRDFRFVLTPDVYAQRLDAAGASLWAANGIAIGAGPGSQGVPVLIAGGGGKAIAAWSDARTDAGDVYAQAVDGTGAALWNPDGMPACRAAGLEDEVAIAPDSTGGAIVAWSDGRNGGSSDIYANRITGSGGVVAAGEVAPPSLRLSAPWPNPGRGAIVLTLDLPAPGPVRARVIDLRGRQVATLADGAEFPAGRSVLRWQAAVAGPGTRRAPGLYLIEVHAGAATACRRVVLLD